MEHIRKLPGTQGRIAFDCVREGVHTCGGSQALWHTGHHVWVYKGDDRNVMYVNTDKFTFFFDIGNNVVNGDFCCGTGSGWNGKDWNTGILCRGNAFKTADIFKFRVGNDNTNGFGRIHGGTAANGDQVICARSLKGRNTCLHIFDGGIRLDFRVNFVIKACFIKNIRYLFCHIKFHQIRVRTDKGLFKAARLCFGCNFIDCAAAVI